jgi:hypothetical protein
LQALLDRDAAGGPGLAAAAGDIGRAAIARLATLATAATVRNRRRVVSTGMFVGGVLNTRSALAVGFDSLVVGVRAGAEPRNFPSACFSVKPKFMKKSIKVAPKKKRGRPSTGKDPHMAARMPAALIAQVEAWATANDASRSEAFRRLVELGLTVKTTAKQPSSARADRAKELATKAIEKIIDPAAPPNERAQRRRRLTKGPTEFREDRVDLPKAKK